MSEQYEPSYYEIALTGRQVLAGFVILLVCLVAAFFSGVWVGRGGRGEGRQAAQAAAQNPPAEAPRGPELSFFDEKPAEGAGGRAGAARTAGPATPAPGDLSPGSEDGQPTIADRAAPPPATPATPAASETAQGGTSAPGTAQGSPAQAPPATRAGAGGTRAAPSAQASPSGSLATGDVVIQVFSSGEEAKARDVLRLLEKNGFRAFLSPVADGGRTLYRVRVGPFEHKSEAQEVAEKLHRALNLETWITQ